VNRRRNGPDIGIVAEHADEMGLAVLSDVTVDAYGTAPARNVDRKALREIPTWREGPPRCWQLVDFLVSSTRLRSWSAHGAYGPRDTTSLSRTFCTSPTAVRRSPPLSTSFRDATIQRS
jgi:hypothetical protein